MASKEVVLICCKVGFLNYSLTSSSLGAPEGPSGNAWRHGQLSPGGRGMLLHLVDKSQGCELTPCSGKHIPSQQRLI